MNLISRQQKTYELVEIELQNGTSPYEQAYNYYSSMNDSELNEIYRKNIGEHHANKTQ